MKSGVSVLLLLFIALRAFAQDHLPSAWPEIGSVDLSFEATEEMRSFLDRPDLRPHIDDSTRARRIIQHLFGSEGDGFAYDASLTLAPADAFRQRKGNCITFAMLFVTLSREIGLRTQFNEVNANPSWSQNRDLVIETGHVNAIVFAYPQNFVVEWLDSYRDLSNQFLSTVSDDKIRSDYYSNLGIAAMAEGDYPLAKTYLEYAEHIDPKNPSVWQNFGVLWLRMGDAAMAEQAFLTGVKYSGKQSSLFFLLAKLYQKQGNTVQADKFLKKGQRYAKKNPFFHYQMAMDDFENERFKESKAHLYRAVSKLPHYHLFHYMLAKCHEALGEYDLRDRELHAAIETAQTPEIAKRYQQLLIQIQTTQSK